VDENTGDKHKEYFDINKLPKNLLGSEIISIGKPMSGNYSGGGIGIIFKAKDGLIYQCIMGFDETGIWIEDYSEINSGLK
jgi:hypothetical protein